MDKLFHHDVFVRYLEQESKDIDGYLQSGSASLIWSIFDVQEEINVTGNIAEIGVYHGKLLIYMCLKLNKGERAFAIDVFDSNPSIQGIKTIEEKIRFNVKNLESNLTKFGLGKEHVTIIAADSQKLNELELSENNLRINVNIKADKSILHVSREFTFVGLCFHI